MTDVEDDEALEVDPDEIVDSEDIDPEFEVESPHSNLLAIYGTFVLVMFIVLGLLAYCAQPTAGWD